MKGRKILASALLTGMVMSPAVFAQVSTLSDDVLADVSAQGVQVITNPTAISNQENNNDSVQLNGNSQSGSSGMEVLNHSDSASNVHQNSATISSSSNIIISQNNIQIARNRGKSEQNINNSSNSQRQNNNNASVQLSDSAQINISASIASNASASAVNIGENVVSLDSLNNANIDQRNVQRARNNILPEQNILNSGYFSYLENNNNGSVQLNDNAQFNSRSIILNNSASSAKNIAHNLIEATNLNNTNTISQANIQRSRNGSKGMQEIGQNIIERDNTLQNNNQVSIQLNDNAQANVNSDIITNSAYSAENIGQNYVAITGLNAVNNINMSNRQRVVNFTKFDVSQDVMQLDSDSQKNLVSSIELNNNAQSNITAFSITNTSTSASNIAQNLGSSVASIGYNTFSQLNNQVARNGTNWENWSFQTINSDDISFPITSLNNQDNLNASVQLNDNTNAQNDIKAMILANTAHSASNIAENVAVAQNDRNGNTFEQRNRQRAFSETFIAQDIRNSGEYVENSNQDNLNGSVQVHEGQNRFSGHILTNSANSSVNIAQNISSAINLDGLNLGIQTNRQLSNLSIRAEQNINNFSDNSQKTEYQNNNNASVQVFDGQDSIHAFTVSNIASSAQNIAQNINYYSSISNISNISQRNNQIVRIDGASQQNINNITSGNDRSDYQQNNNASIQILNTHNDENIFSLSNSALSAVNIAQNIVTIDDLSGTDNVDQINRQRANSYTQSIQNIFNIPGLGGFSEANYQNNNNASNQLINAQNSFNGYSLSNSIMSAVNIGQNIANVDNPIGLTTLVQDNIQTSYAEASYQQNITNGATVSQNNNNGANQLFDSQNGISSYVVINSIGSAVNSETNVANITGSRPNGTILDQITDDYTENNSNFTQYVENGDVVNEQNNNNSSVQINNSQVNSTAIDLSNTAGTAHNYGNNISSVINASGWMINQVANQTSINR